ncbi:TPA: hypothetical protein DCZ46_02825 [Candidatus Campbellbacteria bacterium]|nr:MAG: metal dependent phosphohydrolase, putative hydrolases of HD superfamily [Candidatus Campbellbacteria bacterium GW2011_OD1_34_28]KKP74940.1 MAG: Metal dependent phosphohydrolase [Candidatus Campbellbacteria bacterium GW2011_GWD2_35_24]KKP75826.1 MAG: hypothetical protein UR75_C0002G0207 [Candidatus Campbellbacteria bacterium GW2011_GWC2_35_28]KKP76926.1 MAG: Metal dependent phosphohydrolase [Candidatus Campbellbacteria bacterium GW2011_GWC1_35_31]KKP78852.1 MAG: Metal dependent phosphohy
MKDLQNILKFTKLLNEFRKIERMNLSSRGDRKENDAEHSYQLAMLGWYISTTQKMDLDFNLVIKYSLIHDLVEIYAGDTYVYTKNIDLKNSQKEREFSSLERLKSEFGEISDIFDLIEEYEKRENKESKFVYALDKVEPMISNYLHRGKVWKENNIKLENIINHKINKVSEDKEVERIFKKLIELMRKEEKDLFN